jgi:hypothetical protein
MNQNLLVGLLGGSKSGKSFTWNTLFDKPEVKTGKNLRRLYLNDYEYVNVFLINRSAELRKKSISQIITVDKPRILLCSLQYVKAVVKTINYFERNNYFLYLHWLNPGYHDEHDKPLFYNFGIINNLMEKEGSMIGVRNAKLGVEDRVEEIKNFIYGWAKGNGLLGVNELRKKRFEQLQEAGGS